MLVIFGCFLLATAVTSSAIVSQPCQQEPCPVGAVKDELRLERRLDQLELTMRKQNSLLESIVNSLNEVKLQSSQILSQQIKHQKRIIESCDEATTSGRYHLQLPNSNSTPIVVVCEMELLDGGWLEIQTRFTGSVDFNRSWAEYREGFGPVAKSDEFWLGLEAVHQLTKTGEYELMVQLKRDFSEGNARYQKFKIAGEEEGYKLLEVDDYQGDVGNQLKLWKNYKFSTYDRNNEQGGGNCAQRYGCGWWFSGSFLCSSVILNGPFEEDDDTNRGIYWAGWAKAATYSRMLIRRRLH